MAKKFEVLCSVMNKEAQDEVDRQLNAAMEAMSLHELRRVHGLSQKIAAQTFGGQQTTVVNPN